MALERAWGYLSKTGSAFCGDTVAELSNSRDDRGAREGRGARNGFGNRMKKKAPGTLSIAKSCDVASLCPQASHGRSWTIRSHDCILYRSKQHSPWDHLPGSQQATTPFIHTFIGRRTTLESTVALASTVLNTEFAPDMTSSTLCAWCVRERVHVRPCLCTFSPASTQLRRLNKRTSKAGRDPLAPLPHPPPPSRRM